MDEGSWVPYLLFYLCEAFLFVLGKFEIKCEGDVKFWRCVVAKTFVDI